jgi:hypothetical protein
MKKPRRLNYSIWLRIENESGIFLLRKLFGQNASLSLGKFSRNIFHFVLLLRFRRVVEMPFHTESSSMLSLVVLDLYAKVAFFTREEFPLNLL